LTRRYAYLLLLCLLAIITYLDRVCISVAGPRIQDALHLVPEKWGWVGTVFLVGVTPSRRWSASRGRGEAWGWRAHSWPPQAVVAAAFSTGHVAVIVALSLAYTGITLQQPPVLAACLDIGGLRGGAVVGFMNTAAAVGAALSSVVFGYIVKATGDYDAPLIPMAVLLAAGVALWLKVDVTQRIEE